MKKIGLITYHNSYNYGASLQAYATVALLKNIGYETEVINYYSNNLKGFGTLKKTFEETKYKSKNPVKRVLLTTVRIPSYKKLKKTFDRFASCNLPLTKEYYSSEEIKANLPKVDAFCTGSDQVWNNYYTHYFEGAYFLDFVPDNYKCFSLASSFGKESFNSEELSYIRKHMKKYDYISVREASAKKILNNLGFNSVSVMLDPTLLVDIECWNEFANAPAINEPYILVYQLHGDGNAYKHAIEFGKKNNIEVIRIDTFYHQARRDCKNVIIPDPRDFLGYFKNAKYVFTDSFHGTVFSILFDKLLAVDMPHKFSDRINTLLTSIGADLFILESLDDWEKEIQTVDYKKIKSQLQLLKEDRINEIKSFLASL